MSVHLKNSNNNSVTGYWRIFQQRIWICFQWIQWPKLEKKNIFFYKNLLKVIKRVSFAYSFAMEKKMFKFKREEILNLNENRKLRNQLSHYWKWSCEFFIFLQFLILVFPSYFKYDYIVFFFCAFLKKLYELFLAILLNKH